MVFITIVTAAYKPTYNWGAPHCSNFQTHPCRREMNGYSSENLFYFSQLFRMAKKMFKSSNMQIGTGWQVIYNPTVKHGTKFIGGSYRIIYIYTVYI